MRKFILGLLNVTLIMIIIQFSAYSKNEENPSIILCPSNAMPLDLNKLLGISFMPGTGSWYNEEGMKVSNVVVFSDTELAKGSLKYSYKLSSINSTCIGMGDSEFDVFVSFRNLLPPTGLNYQLFCYEPGKEPVIGDIKVNESNVKWHSSIKSNEHLENSSPLINGSIYYGSLFIEGCGESEERLAVEVATDIVPDVQLSDTVISAHGNVDLNKVIDMAEDINNTNGLWSFYDSSPDTINDISSLITGSEISKSGTYYIMKNTVLGCFDVDSLSIDLIEGLRIPKVITPNNDGINDMFVIEGLENYENNELIIANRSGHVVFLAKNYQNDWNGESNSQLTMGRGILPEGTYFFVLRLTDSNIVIKDYVFIKH